EVVEHAADVVVAGAREAAGVAAQGDGTAAPRLVVAEGGPGRGHDTGAVVTTHQGARLVVGFVEEDVDPDERDGRGARSVGDQDAAAVAVGRLVLGDEAARERDGAAAVGRDRAAALASAAARGEVA